MTYVSPPSCLASQWCCPALLCTHIVATVLQCLFNWLLLRDAHFNTQGYVLCSLNVLCSPNDQYSVHYLITRLIINTSYERSQCCVKWATLLGKHPIRASYSSLFKVVNNVVSHQLLTKNKLHSDRECCTKHINVLLPLQITCI